MKLYNMFFLESMKCPASLSVFAVLGGLLFSLTVSHCGYPRVLRAEISNSESDRGGDGKNCK